MSELLQSQLLQDININPVQPTLSESGFNVISSGGPARPGFNEFTPLFERNQAQLNTTGVIGNNSTRGGETVLSGIYDKLSLSAGQYLYKSNGFRKNFDLRDDISDLFAQAAVTPELNVQAEFRRRRVETGDLGLFFDPLLRRKPGFERDLDQDTGRFGARYSPTPQSDIIYSFIYSKRHEKNDFGNVGVDVQIIKRDRRTKYSTLPNRNPRTLLLASPTTTLIQKPKVRSWKSSTRNGRTEAPTYTQPSIYRMTVA